MSTFGKIKDILNPTDDIGRGLMKGMLEALEKYPILGAVMKGKRVIGELTFSVQFKVEE